MRTAAAVLLALILALPVFAASRHDEPVSAFREVPTASPSEVARRPSLGPITDWLEVLPTVRPPVVVQPSPRLIVVERSPQPTSHRASGTASWYCGHGSACTRGYPGGLYAAAGPALRTGAYRGRTVLVTSGRRTVAVKLIDWCACPGGRLLDLYSDAFSRLAPLSRGLVKVTVSWT